jgi:uncharacterized protein involved in cysteine biosynthesis
LLSPEVPVFKAYTAAARQLGDPPIKRVIIAVAAWTAGIYLVLGFLLSSVVFSLDPSLWFAWIPISFIQSALVSLAGLVAGVLGFFVLFALFWLLFVIIVQTVSSFYLERVIAAVEARHYPDLPPARAQPIAEVLISTLQFFGFMVVLNLIALPFYFIPLLGVGLFYLINGYLIGREYFELVAFRRVDQRVARTLRKEHRGTVLGTGLVTTVLFSIPLLNLVAPVLTAAAMVHRFQAVAGSAPPPAQAETAPDAIEADHA